jgi:uncharacterized membrane protein
MRRVSLLTMLMISALVLVAASALAFKMPSWGNDKFTKISPKNGIISIPIKNISDGKAHYFMVKADDGVMVSFFTLKSKDNVIRAAIDACDVCYKAGKGYVQDGDFMICENCGQRFASNRINVIKGGCNPAPLNRVVQGDNLIVQMKDINANSWYCRYKKQ